MGLAYYIFKYNSWPQQYLKPIKTLKENPSVAFFSQSFAVSFSIVIAFVAYRSTSKILIIL